MNSKLFLNRVTHTIFIMLGNECNLNCRYCLQHPLVHNQISHDINPDIYEFIEQVHNENNGRHLRIQFFGGEPLLFFNNIKDIVNELSEIRNLDNISYSVISNGKAITQEMIDLFIRYNFWVCISYDGFNVLETRGYNAFEDNSHQKELILSIPNLGISTVLSSYAYPKDICKAQMVLDSEYYEIHNKHLYMNVDELMDTGCIPQDISDIDLDRVYSEVYEMAKVYLSDVGRPEDQVDPRHYADNIFISDRYRNLSRFYSPKYDNGVWKDYYCCCGNGYDTLNLGLDGTLYPCHNTSESTGSIYDNYYNYLNNILRTDNTLSKRKECEDCPVIAFCHGGCKMIPNDKQESYCNLKKSVYLPILNAVREYGQSLSNV